MIYPILVVKFERNDGERMEPRPTGARWVGVDLGTQSVRVIVTDDAGHVLGHGSAPLTSRRGQWPGRQHEQDPRQWWEAVGTASRQAFGMAPAPDAAPVGAVAICSTSGTVLLTDDRGAPLTAAVMYDDARASAELEHIYGRTDDDVDVQLSWALPKIGWLYRHHGGSGLVAHSADFVAGALVGHRVHTDSSHALKSGYDVVEGRWDGELLDAAGIDVLALPQVVPPGTELGTVTAAAAEHTGIPRGTPVVAGMTDGCGAQIAAGALALGSWNSVLGTTLVLKGVAETPISDPDGAVYNHRHPDGGWLPGGASNVGAGVLAHEFAGADLEALDAAAQAYEPAKAVIYPLTARGERFPFVRPDAVRFELGEATEPAERYAAMIQGVAFVERLCYDHLAAIGADVTGEISVSGGATRSDYWTQLRADVLGRPLVVPAIPEPAFGMAVLASARDERVTDRAARMVTRRAVVEPRPDAHERLSAGYDRLTTELMRRGYYVNESPGRLPRRTR